MHELPGAVAGLRGQQSSFAEHGAAVAFTYLSSDEKAKVLEDRLAGMGVKTKGYKSDAGDFKAAEQLANDVVKEFGTIDICVNNAGISRDNLLLRLTPEQWDEVMQANLKSVYNLTKQVIRPMMKSRNPGLYRSHFGRNNEEDEQPFQDEAGS